MLSPSDFKSIFSNYEPLTKEEKIKVLHSKGFNKKVFRYLEKKLANLSIGIVNDKEKNVMELMNEDRLFNWSFESTETIILFLENDDYIERGYIKLGEYNYKYQSWICFKFNNLIYVLDPSLNVICEKHIYDNILNPEVLGKTSALNVKKYFLNEVEKSKDLSSKEQLKKEFLYYWLSKNIGIKELAKIKNEIIIHGNDNLNSPMCNRGIEVAPEIEDGYVRKLRAHYYLNKLHN